MTNSPKILLVEDDQRQADDLTRAIQAKWPDADVRTILTEEDFINSFDSLAQQNFDLAVLDLMLRFAWPREHIVYPDEVKKTGYFRGGDRCRTKLLEDSRTRDIKILLVTALDPDSTNVSDVVEKDDSLQGILEAIAEKLA